jgi:methionyl aminopeptidase
MPVVLKSSADIVRMRAAGALLADVHDRLRERARPGVTTRELDQLAYDAITSAGAEPSFLGYRGYPASICASINHVILHGIPDDRVIQDGDILSIDIGVKLNGFHADRAVTLPIGSPRAEAIALIETAEECFWRGFERLTVGGRLGDAASAIHALAASRGYGVVREYSGHGVGRQMHEDPSVPNFGEPGSGSLVRIGMTFALEPMLTLGSPETRILADGWTVVTVDGSLAAHYEHTIAILEEGPVVLTQVASGVL